MYVGQYDISELREGRQRRALEAALLPLNMHELADLAEVHQSAVFGQRAQIA
jgi:hypothetical protein